jgi:hypothetical protein
MHECNSICSVVCTGNLIGAIAGSKCIPYKPKSKSKPIKSPSHVWVIEIYDKSANCYRAGNSYDTYREATDASYYVEEKHRIRKYVVKS